MNSLRNLDHLIFNYLYHFFGQSHFRDQILIFLAIYLIYALPVVLIMMWFWSIEIRKAALRVTFSGLLAWLVFCNLIGHFYFRERPFVAQANIKEFVFHRPDYSFPSDHAAFLFALIFSFWFLGYRKIAGSIFILAIIISLARIIIGIHYPTDIVFGIVIGLFSAVLIWLFRKPLDKVINLILAIGKKMRLGWTLKKV